MASNAAVVLCLLGREVRRGFDALRLRRGQVSRPYGADQEYEVGEQDYGESERGQKCEIRAASFEHLDAQDRGNETAGNEPHHQLALQRGQTGPGQPAYLHGNYASKQNSGQTQKSEQDVVAETSVIDERAQQHEEKRAQKKSQFSMKGEHLGMGVIGCPATLAFDGRFGEPVGPGGFIEMKATANRWKIRERETEDQNRNKVVAFEKMRAGIDEQHRSKRQHVPEAFFRENR